MLIDFTQLITDLSGEVVAYDDKPVSEGGKPMTLGIAAVNALQSVFEDERNLGGDEKMKRFLLAMKIHGASLPLDVTTDEAALIKKLVAKLPSILVYGRVANMLDNPIIAAAKPNGHAEAHLQ
jgi:hypothetical protein